MILMIDNYDSFTYNIVQYLGELGADVQVFRNDEITVEQALALKPEKIVISPGPCTPNEAGISLALISEIVQNNIAVPLLGICLGHQSIAQVFGGKVIRAKEVMHGKLSLMYHNQTGVFRNLQQPFTATRYHSLVVEYSSLPDCFEVTSWTETDAGDFDEIMGIKHKTLNLEGVQFHPESIMSEQGHELLQNFISS